MPAQRDGAKSGILQPSRSRHVRIAEMMEEQLTTKAARRRAADLRAEYNFDFSRARPNRYAAEMKSDAIAVVLDPDVAAVFRSSADVNQVLRSVIEAMPNKTRTKAAVKRAPGPIQTRRQTSRS